MNIENVLVNNDLLLSALTSSTHTTKKYGLRMKIRTCVGLILGLLLIILLPAGLFPVKELSLIAIGLVFGMLIFGFFAKRYKSRPLKLIMLLCGISLLFLWSLHTIKYLCDCFWLVTVMLLAGLVYVGLFPKINPNLAEKIFLESFCPKTRIGQILQRIIPILFFAGFFFVSFGEFDVHESTTNLPMLWTFATDMYFLSVAFVFYIMYDYSKNKPFVWYYSEPAIKYKVKAKSKHRNLLQRLRDNRNIEKYYRDGILVMESGKPRLAINEFSKALELQPDLLEARLVRGVCFATVASDKKAMDDLAASIAIDPSLKAAYYWIGVIYFRRKELDLALENADKAIELNTGAAENYLLRGGIHLEKGNFQNAIDDMNVAINCGFKIDGYNNRALVYEKMGREDLAIADWSEVIRMTPKQPKAYLKRGLLYKKVGKIEEAVNDLTIGLRDTGRVNEKLYVEACEALDELE